MRTMKAAAIHAFGPALRIEAVRIDLHAAEG